ALHIQRTQHLKDGQTLEAFTRDVTERLHLPTTILPMTNDMLRTRVLTDVGELDFQHYFVRLRCEPKLLACRFDGAATATIAPAVIATLRQKLRAILIAPSNPYLSIDPILALPGMRELLRENGAPIIAITPIIDGSAVKGPTAKILSELGKEISPTVISAHYRNLIDGFVLDQKDSHLAEQMDVPVAITNTLMQTLSDRERVAAVALQLADRVKNSTS